MREIKFKVVWNGMVSLDSFRIGHFWEHEVELEFKNGETLQFGDIDWENDEVEYLQFTGIKDKLGQEIYEGWVVKHKLMDTSYEPETTSIGVVMFRPGKRDYQAWGVVLYDEEHKRSWTAYLQDYESVSEWEVIGNMYENKDLIS